MSGDLKARAVLAPSMLLLIAGVYWLDLNEHLGTRQGALCAGLFGLLGVVGTWEFITLLRGGGFPVSKRGLLTCTVLLLVCPFFFAWKELDRELYPIVLGTLLLLFPLAVKSLRRDDMGAGLEKSGATLLGFISVAWPVYLAMGTCFRHLPSLLWVVLVCKGGDIGGYCFGRLFGRTKLIRHISPGKTIEGAIGSLVTSIVLAVSLRGLMLEPQIVLSWPLAIAIGAVLNFTTQVGDLLESLLKRRCGAKDSSRLLPAHGGILDLIDSLLWSVCVWFLVLIWLTGQPS